MNILLVYWQLDPVLRATVRDHLESFRRYGGTEVYYLNAALGVPWYVPRLPFDAVIYHYTFLATKWSLPDFRALLRRCRPLQGVSGHKAALAQDEYLNSEAVCGFIRDHGVGTLFGVVEGEDVSTIYPERLTGGVRYRTVLTGYVDSGTLLRLESSTGSVPRDRPLDIGYRARRPPYWTGAASQTKWRIAEAVRPRAEALGLRVDLSCRESDSLLEDQWYRFLLDCRTVLGCESAISLHDPRGEIRDAVEAYMVSHPDADFDEVEARCFPGRDRSLAIAVLSPRHLECSMTRTCQVLVEGRYSDVLQPERHYIPLRADLDNLDEVLERVRDVDGCAAIAERAFREVASSGHWTYRAFVRSCLDELRTGGARDGPRFAAPLRTWLHARDRLTRWAVVLRRALGRWRHRLVAS